MSKYVKNVDAVADDRNWISRVQNELNCVATWQSDWGFLAGGLDKVTSQDALKIFTAEEQIQNLQKEVNSLTKTKTLTGNSMYGNQGKTLEDFEDKGNYMKTGKDLRPLDRHLPKEWKKKKMDPSIIDDPYDELKDMFKKSKGKK